MKKTLTNKGLAVILCDTLKIQEKQAKKILKALISYLAHEVRSNERCYIPGLGLFYRTEQNRRYSFKLRKVVEQKAFTLRYKPVVAIKREMRGQPDHKRTAHRNLMLAKIRRLVSEGKIKEAKHTRKVLGRYLKKHPWLASYVEKHGGMPIIPKSK